MDGMTINPTRLRWRHDGRNTDGSDFDTSRFSGWEVELNGQSILSVPVGWDEDGEYEAPIAALELAEGDYTLRLRLVATDVASAWSDPTVFAIRKVPAAPFDLAVE